MYTSQQYGYVEVVDQNAVSQHAAERHSRLAAVVESRRRRAEERREARRRRREYVPVA